MKFKMSASQRHHKCIAPIGLCLGLILLSNGISGEETTTTPSLPLKEKPETPNAPPTPSTPTGEEEEGAESPLQSQRDFRRTYSRHRLAHLPQIPPSGHILLQSHSNKTPPTGLRGFVPPVVKVALARQRANNLLALHFLAAGFRHASDPRFQEFQPQSIPRQTFHQQLHPQQTLHHQTHPRQTFHQQLHPQQTLHHQTHPHQTFHQQQHPQRTLHQPHPSQSFHLQTHPQQIFHTQSFPNSVPRSFNPPSTFINRGFQSRTPLRTIPETTLHSQLDPTRSDTDNNQRHFHPDLLTRLHPGLEERTPLQRNPTFQLANPFSTSSNFPSIRNHVRGTGRIPASSTTPFHNQLIPIENNGGFINTPTHFNDFSHFPNNFPVDDQRRFSPENKLPSSTELELQEPSKFPNQLPKSEFDP